MREGSPGAARGDGGTQGKSSWMERCIPSATKRGSPGRGGDEVASEGVGAGDVGAFNTSRWDLGDLESAENWSSGWD